jgi:hypothetical protein
MSAISLLSVAEIMILRMEAERADGGLRMDQAVREETQST